MVGERPRSRSGGTFPLASLMTVPASLPHLILLGPAGTGKGTAARWLAQTYGLSVFETGAALRSAAMHDAQLAHELAAGRMAPTPLVMALLSNAVRSDRQQPPAGWVYDGVPRNRNQAPAFLAFVESGAVPVNRVLVFDAPRPLLRDRLSGRMTCSGCGAIYHREIAPPPRESACTATCSGVLVSRPEDTPAAIAERFALYDRETVPTIAMLAAAGLPITPVDGSQSIATIRTVLRGVMADLAALDAPDGDVRRGPARSRRRAAR
jgi:adenylate kinase